MPGPLTWRQVVAPSARDSVAALGLAGSAFDRAFTGMDDALGRFRTWQEEQAQNAVANAATSISDPVKFRQAMADGSLFQGVDRSLLTAKALQGLDNRAGVLLDQATAQQTYDFNREANPLKLDFARLKNEDARLTNQFNTDTYGTRVAAEDAKLDQTRASTANTRANTARTVQTTGFEARMQPGRELEQTLGNQERQLRLDRGQWLYGNEQVAYADARAGEAAGQEVVRTAPNPLAALQQLEGLQLSPPARAVATKMVEARFGNVYGSLGAPGTAPSPGGAPGATPGGAAMSFPAPGSGEAGTIAGSQYDRVHGDGKYIKPAVPVSQMSLGQAVQFGRDEFIPATRGKVGAGPDKGTSAMGAFQITQETLQDYGPKLFGKDWERTQFNADSQEALAKAIWEDRKNGDLTKTWSSLKDSRPGAYAGKSWEEMRQIIAQGEIGTSLPEIRSSLADTAERARLAEVALNGALAEGNAQGLAAVYDKSSKDNAGAGEVADRLLKQTIWKDISPPRMTEILKAIVDKGQGKINWATAGEILARNPSVYNRLSRMTIPGPDVIQDNAGIDQDIQSVIGGSVYTRQFANQQVEQLLQTVKAAQAEKQQAAATLERFNQMARVNPAYEQYRADYENAYRQVARRVDSLLDVQGKSTTFNPKAWADRLLKQQQEAQSAAEPATESAPVAPSAPPPVTQRLGQATEGEVRPAGPPTTASAAAFYDRNSPAYRELARQPLAGEPITWFSEEARRKRIEERLRRMKDEVR